MNTAEYIVKTLETLGVNDFFGVLGEYNHSLISAVENNQNTNWIGCSNELNAGYAADGYARFKGYGALLATYGPGELSALNAIAGSMSENVPVVCIVGTPSSEYINSKSLLHNNLQDAQYDNFIQAYSSVTAEAVFLTKDNAKIAIDKAIKIMVKEKKPVYIAVPSDIAQMEISDRTVLYDWISNEHTLEEVSQKIVEKINNSKKPLIIGDILVKRFNAEIEYKEFCEKSGIPISNFLMGKNLINEDLENYIGGYYASYQNSVVCKYLEETDCLITVGAICSDWNAFGFNNSIKITHQIAIYGTYTYIDGIKYESIKMSDVLDKVSKILDKKEYAIEKSQEIYVIKEPENVPITSDFIYSRLQKFIKDNDIIISDSGIIPFGVSQIKMPENVKIESQFLWNSAGWATPATLGVCVAKPKTRVILVSGDGAHLMTALEIGNLVKHGMQPVVIIINNHGYATEKLISQSFENTINDTFSLNYAKFARTFEGDVWATTVTTEEDFDKALKVSQIMNKLCYIEVCIEPVDVPKIAEEFFINGSFNNKFEVSTKRNNTLSQEDVVLTNNASVNGYETTVHQAFNEINKLFVAEDSNE